MATQQNKKLTLGILLTFIICIGSAILATYSTGPYGNYPNPGVHPGMIGPGTFNDSEVANPQWNIPGNLDVIGNATIQGKLNISSGLVIGNPANGSMGAGTINVENIYVNGKEISKGFDSENSMNLAVPLLSSIYTVINNSTTYGPYPHNLNWVLVKDFGYLDFKNVRSGSHAERKVKYQAHIKASRSCRRHCCIGFQLREDGIPIDTNPVCCDDDKSWVVEWIIPNGDITPHHYEVYIKQDINVAINPEISGQKFTYQDTYYQIKY